MAICAVLSVQAPVARCATTKPSARRSGALPPAQTRQRTHCCRIVARTGGAPGGGVLDRPSVAPGQDKRRESKKRRPPSYRVLLHNDNYNRREYVVQVLLKVVEGTTVDDAVNIMNEAHANGLALVAECAQDKAEQYCESLRLNGLICTIEPSGGGSGGGGGNEPSTS
ncbi:hypothetical protein D9Q98_004550 [Chlorella vulgaris]|uniref:Adaptor protein ClpS core domain-containing protein n=1 Tax=Chlorella vulgaris TaxID=3077 RepID=A0A9D4TR63_CHLVU|nr:hypothetical protein D9Q98_004550 [Chlorella vulgaris]